MSASDKPPRLPGPSAAVTGDYEIGYRKPPARTRFSPGRSGNPRGRPKGATSAKALFARALSAPVTITEDGAIRRIERLEAIFKATIARSLRGDPRATALVVKLIEHFGLDQPDAGEKPTIIFTWTPPESSELEGGLLEESARLPKGPLR